MIRVAIVDDEQEACREMVSYVEKYCARTLEKIETVVFSDGEALVEEYGAGFDILFLDVRMKHMDGMTTAEYIRKLDQEVEIIFVTSMAQYAIKGYEVRAMDYLVKPVSECAFAERLHKAIGRIRKRTGTILLIPVENGAYRLDTRKIHYIESEGHKLHIYAETGDWTLSGTMKAMESQLASHHFARCNNGYLVNLANVKTVRQNAVVVGNYTIQISRPKRKAFMEALMNYIVHAGR